MLPHIPPSQIDTPWEPQDIIWREGDQETRARTLNHAVDSGLEFLVREAFVQHPNRKFGPMDLSLGQVEELLEHTDKEFELIKTVGIVAAPTEWHSFVDDEGRVRTLAKVAVVDGTSYKNPGSPETPSDDATVATDLDTRIKEYLRIKSDGHRLYDTVRRTQYVYGQIRNDDLRVKHTPNDSHCLVDIEPVYWLYRA